jgi:signal transduction histidine kinase
MSDTVAAHSRPPRSGAATECDKGAESDAPVTRALRRFGRRYPAVGRAVVGALCAVAGSFAAPPQGVGVAVAAALTVVGWNLAYLWMLLPDGRPQRWYWWTCVVDAVLLCGLCLAQPLLVDPARLAASLGWVSPMASFTVVVVQFQLGRWAAAAVTVAVCTAFVIGVAASPGLTVVDGLLAGGAWMAVEAVLGRLLWVLLQRAGREADRLMRAQFDAERAAATAAARRSAQRAHWATVHDTSASTLLMIGLGAVTGSEEWLPGQVRRDIGLLDGAGDAPPDADAAEVALEPALAEVARAARVRVEVDCPAGVAEPPAVVRAVVGATAEALENVARHAGVDEARVGVRVRDNGILEVTVADDGAGFHPGRVGVHRFGLALSVRDRMAAAGGHAVVESEPGRGTVVRLRWPA